MIGRLALIRVEWASWRCGRGDPVFARLDPRDSKLWMAGSGARLKHPFLSYALKSGMGYAERLPRAAGLTNDGWPWPACCCSPASHTHARTVAGQEDPPGSAVQQGAAAPRHQEPPVGFFGLRCSTPSRRRAYWGIH